MTTSQVLEELRASCKVLLTDDLPPVYSLIPTVTGSVLYEHEGQWVFLTSRERLHTDAPWALAAVRHTKATGQLPVDAWALAEVLVALPDADR